MGGTIPQIAPSCGGGVLDPHLLHDSWTYQSQPPNGISISSAVFAVLTNVTNTLATLYSVCSSRPLSLAISAMRPNNNSNDVKCGCGVSDARTVDGMLPAKQTARDAREGQLDVDVIRCFICSALHVYRFSLTVTVTLTSEFA